jgi:hypothetical protein
LFPHQKDFLRVLVDNTPSLSMGLEGDLATTNTSIHACLSDNYIPSSCILSFGS